jgi:hypothetical protein
MIIRINYLEENLNKAIQIRNKKLEVLVRKIFKIALYKET